jgi:phage FluMu protein Com
MTPCPEHGITQPCGPCAADHHAGMHAYPETYCPRCQQAQATPTTDARRAAAGDQESDD